jgi:hypothetical protein
MTDAFYAAVRLLRALPERYRVMALHAALFWSDERLSAAEMDGYLPGQADEIVKPNVPTTLKLVSNTEPART